MTRCLTVHADGRRCMLVAHDDTTPHWAGTHWGGRCAVCGKPAELAHEECSSPAEKPDGLVERCARARAESHGYDWSRMGPGERSPYLETARITLEAAGVERMRAKADALDSIRALYDLNEAVYDKEVPRCVAYTKEKLETAERSNKEARGHLDAIAAALHPHWSGTGHTYCADELAGKIERMQDEIVRRARGEKEAQKRAEQLNAERNEASRRAEQAERDMAEQQRIQLDVVRNCAEIREKAERERDEARALLQGVVDDAAKGWHVQPTRYNAIREALDATQKDSKLGEETQNERIQAISTQTDRGTTTLHGGREPGRGIGLRVGSEERQPEDGRHDRAQPGEPRGSVAGGEVVLRSELRAGVDPNSGQPAGRTNSGASGAKTAGEPAGCSSLSSDVATIARIVCRPTRDPLSVEECNALRRIAERNER